MTALSAIISRFEAAYLQQYAHANLPSQRQARAAMKRCRTTLAPRMLAHCSACEKGHSVL